MADFENWPGNTVVYWIQPSLSQNYDLLTKPVVGKLSSQLGKIDKFHKTTGQMGDSIENSFRFL